SPMNHLILISISIGSIQALLPPAPYHFQLRCLAGSSSPSLSTCNSSSTACAYFYSQHDESKGHYTCIDETAFARSTRGVVGGKGEERQSLLMDTCGPTPGCSLLPPFALTNQTYTRFGLVNTKPIKFCCSLFSNTLVKLVEDVSFQPKEPLMMTCGGSDCDTGAVGCLVYARTKENIREEWMERVRRTKRQNWEGVNAVEVSFGSDEEDAEKLKQKEQIGKEEEHLGDDEEYSTEIVEYSEEDEDDEPIEASTQCVYRHLQDEFYKYCLLVHSKNEPLKCTAHLGYTICCCFVFPGSSSCDPTRVQKPKTLPTLKPKLLTTTAIPPTSTSTTAKTTTAAATTVQPVTTTTSSTTTTTSTTQSPISTSTPVEAPKCDVEYVHQLGGKRQMKIVCSSHLNNFSSLFIGLFVTRLLW
ncbi:hypothetical protein PFISCL1PPCAC_8041, partial [Pristionchus fissidentatus]